MRFTLIAIPNSEILDQLEKLREFFYLNNFRYKNRKPTGVSHITLAKGELDSGTIDTLRESLAVKLDSFGDFVINYTTVTNKVHERIYTNEDALKKYPDGCSWISLLFSEPQLKSLASICIEALIENGIDKTGEYADNLKQCVPENERSEHVIDYVADHMNIYNYARIEKGAEAQAIIMENDHIKNFSIDRIAAYSDKNEVLWEIAL